MPDKSEDPTYLESPHVLEAQEILKHYNVNLDYGLNDEQAERYRELYGSHTFVKPKKVSLFYLFITQFDDLLVKILLSAAVISFFLTLFDSNERKDISSFIEPIVILFILILNAIVGVWQEANAERALDALKKLQPTLASCLRNGVWQVFETEHLVVGDIVKVKNGDKVPSDVRVVKILSTSLLVEQSQLTGESFLIYKTNEALPKDLEKCELQSKRNILFGSTTVCGGTAIGVVVATGMKTEIGAIQSAVIEASSENTTTPLQNMLNDFGTYLSKVITVICIVVWAINFRNFSDPVHGSTLRGCIYYFKIAIALAVAAIPEGLPAVITTCLALGTRKMAKRNAIVRKLPSIETLGCTTVICSDKTGTLTTNRMTCVVLNLFNSDYKLRYIHMPAISKGSEKGSTEKHNITVTLGGFGQSGLCVAQSFDGPIEPLTHSFLKCASLCSDVTITTGSVYSRHDSKEGKSKSSKNKSDSKKKGNKKKKDSKEREVNLSYSGLLLEGEPTEVAIIEMVNNLGKYLTNSDTAHLDKMGRMIFQSHETDTLKKKRLFRLSPSSREEFNDSKDNLVSKSDSQEESFSDSSHVSRISSYKDDVSTLGVERSCLRSRSPSDKSSNCESPNPELSSPNKSPKSTNQNKTKETHKKIHNNQPPTSLLYRKYLRREATLEFCRTRKMMSVIVRDESKFQNEDSNQSFDNKKSENNQSDNSKTDENKDRTTHTGNLYVYTKGAPESVLEICNTYMLPDGTVEKMGKNEREEVLNQIRLLANEALRVLAFGYRQGSSKDLEYYKSLKNTSTQYVNDNQTQGSSPNQGEANTTSTKNKFDKIERDLTFLGLVGIMDPPRPEVKDAISKCMRAGIRVLMITGDNKLTAEAIARKIGIIKQTVTSTLTSYSVDSPSSSPNPIQSKLQGLLKGSLTDRSQPKNTPYNTARGSGENEQSLSDESKVKTVRSSSSSPVFASLTGKEFESLSLESQKKLLSNTCLVFSRTEPKHKQNIVSILKDLGEIVAMTGDGVNDAPALKMADIGISMGINGTEVAKEASDMILADDNFNTIVSAIEEGRCIYSNMKAFIRYLISSNIGEVVSIFMTAMFGIPEGMLPVQLLWVNLVTDGPPATALGFNPPDPLVMKKEPRNRDDKLIDRLTLFRYIIIGLYVGFATCGIFIMYFVYGISPNEGNTLVTFHMLRDWGSCQAWSNFEAKPLYGMENSCQYFTIGKIKASTLSLTTLVMLEMFNSYNALSEDSSLLKMPPWKNMYLILATFFSVFIHCLILYVPFLSNMFNVVPLDLYDWKWVLVWSFPVVLIDEVIKFSIKLYKRKSKPKLRFSSSSKIKSHKKKYRKSPWPNSHNLPEIQLLKQDLLDRSGSNDENNKKSKDNKNEKELKNIWNEPKSSSLSFTNRLSSGLSNLLEKISFSRSNSGSSNLSSSVESSDEELKEVSKFRN